MIIFNVNILSIKDKYDFPTYFTDGFEKKNTSKVYMIFYAYLWYIYNP